MKMTGEWGEFFPHEMSPFGYNETVAAEYFPLTRKEALSMPTFDQWGKGDGSDTSTLQHQGWNWRNEDETTSFHGEYYTPLPINSYDESCV